ncbi:thiamine diphosphokinase [Peribacillus glennii]|uniref:Thiamine diphosphokinase n=1 Tax=Peribacillus glennii TaxID=2303991 RepID=A0A372LBP9_9BACI|nr:thiamine diphosphokinase [Peribacillus glennii]RFU63324.1 thiamine diphosphokinase [Peribacillus glennii]
MIICILAGGPPDCVPNLNIYKEMDASWIGVDRGVYTLLENGITPRAAFGDFDSVSETELEAIQNEMRDIHLYPSEKDETDLEIALNWAISQNPAKLYIFGATGGRLDHLLANVQMLLREDILDKKPASEIFIIDKTNILTVKRPGIHQLKGYSEKKYVSFVPATNEVKGITLKGFKYPLKNRDIKMGSTLCISNELISECGTFSFSEGILMVIRSSD